MSRTKVTPKYQTTIPKEIRNRLGIKVGDVVEWNLIRQFAIVRTVPKIADPVKFLTSQIRMKVDAVALVRKARSEMFL